MESKQTTASKAIGQLLTSVVTLAAMFGLTGFNEYLTSEVIAGLGMAVGTVLVWFLTNKEVKPAA